MILTMPGLEIKPRSPAQEASMSTTTLTQEVNMNIYR